MNSKIEDMKKYQGVYCDALSRTPFPKKLHGDLCQNVDSLDLGKIAEQKWGRFIGKLIEQNGEQAVVTFLESNKQKLETDFDSALEEFESIYYDSLETNLMYDSDEDNKKKPFSFWFLGSL